MPCLNEAETLAICIDKARKWLKAAEVNGEVIVADNGSTDGSTEIARTHGARVVQVGVRGYGAALRGGCLKARGKYVIMGDADDSYDFSQLDGIMEKLRGGADLVMGDRFAGGVDPGAMPWLHKYLGNPVLSFIGRVLFHSQVRDFHCGLRGYRREAMTKLNLQSLGMEYASEMVIKAELAGLRIDQTPVALHVDGRSRKPHLNTWRDGWRHLRLLMIYAPQKYFLVPGLGSMILGALLEFALSGGPIFLGPIRLAMGTLVVATLFCMIGAEFICLGIATRDYALRNKYLDLPQWRYGTMLTTKTIFWVSVVALCLGAMDLLGYVLVWDVNSMHYLSFKALMGGIVPAVTLLLIGTLGMFAVFMSVLDEPAGRMTDAELLPKLKAVRAE